MPSGKSSWLLPVGKLIVGKKYFKREVDNPEKAIGDGRFVVVPSQAGVVYIISDPLTLATAKTSEWIDRTSFQVEKVKTLEVRKPDGESWKLERAGDNDIRTNRLRFESGPRSTSTPYGEH